MKYIWIAVLVLACSAFGQDWNPAKCRKTFEDRHTQLALHFGSMTDSPTEQFKSSVGKIPTRDLIRWQQELGTCTHNIDGERTLYSVVSRQLNEVLNERFSAYVLDAKQGLVFSEWEREKQREQSFPQSQEAGP
jgi:hypothetical protein